MQSAWFSRLFFAAVGAVAIAGLVSGAACTRWGKPAPVPPTIVPLSSIYVNAKTGNDSTGNGMQSSPYKTLTKAVTVLASSKSLSSSGVTIYLSNGTYDAANGEIFPIVVPKSVTVSGSNYGSGPKNGTYIDGSGQDRTFEQLAHAAPRTAYVALEIAAAASVTATGLYVGDSQLKLPNSRAAYSSVDVLGTLNASNSAFGAGTVTALRNVNGVLVAGGTFNCASCQVHANDFGIGGLSVPVATASPSGTGPSITLSHTTGDSIIAARIVDIITDGTTNVTVSGVAFERGEYAFEDALAPVIPINTRGSVDFGGGAGNSGGGNVFIGARVSEISIVRRFETVSALDDTWNPGQQRANRNGQYTHKIVFSGGARGKNVTILHDARGSTVTVGPAPIPTPTPSSSPSTGPSPTPT